MADQQGSAIPNRPSLNLSNSGQRTNLRLSFSNQGSRSYQNNDSDSPGNIVYSPTSPVSIVTTTTGTTSTSTTNTQMGIVPPPRNYGRPKPPNLPPIPVGSLPGLGSARLQKGSLQLDLRNGTKPTFKPTPSIDQQSKSLPKLNLNTGPSISQGYQQYESLSSAERPRQKKTKSPQNSPRSTTNGSTSRHNVINGVTEEGAGRSTKADHGYSRMPSLHLDSDKSTDSVKKKSVVSHLPPPGPHPSSTSSGHLHHHHHHPHHLVRHHHEGGRERSHTKRDRITRGIGGIYTIQSSGKLKISPELQVEFTADDLSDLGEIGRGGFGTVNKMIHRKSNTIMAVKRIRSTVDEKEQKELLMDLDVVMRSNECPCIVQFYGAIFKEGDCWICMELMDTSLDKFYKFIYERLEARLPENMLGKITVATLIALNYLKEELKIIHRDVKPSNILLDRRGNIKLCDFGISGQLVDSIAKTRDAGCRPYMAPERIDPARARGYDVRSDVWSLGITLMELATGSFPYPKWNSVFEQLTQVVQGEPPRLTLNENGNIFTEEFVNFVNTCLIKDEGSRPKYKQLLEHEFVVRSREDPMDVAGYIGGIMDQMASNGRHMYTYDSYNY